MSADELLPAPVHVVEVVTPREVIAFEFDKKKQAEQLANTLSNYPADRFFAFEVERGLTVQKVWLRPSHIAAIRVYEHG